MGSIIGNFFIPHKFNNQNIKNNYKITAIIPSFKPGKETTRLVQDLLRWNEDIQIYVVDDSTPIEYEEKHRIFECIKTLSPQVIVLRTPKNKMKAGAINQALSHIFSEKSENFPDVILTLDDDVVISRDTIKNLVNNLFEDDRLGAVCSQCRVINKNENFLTRLQGLEYLGFNAIRLSDEGFFWGPLVMHGMLTAFRFSALEEIGLFKEKDLIEDYEATVRIKMKGWHVRLAPHSYAWTRVPAKFSDLWRQRTRWMVGGLFIAMNFRYWKAIIQDVMGHLLFISTFLFVVSSFLLSSSSESIPVTIPIIIMAVSFLQILIWYIFQIWFMRFYVEKDWKDWLIRIALIPEFIYANVLSVILLGSYIFYIFQMVFVLLGGENQTSGKIKTMVEKIFSFAGYSNDWGTRQK